MKHYAMSLLGMCRYLCIHSTLFSVMYTTITGKNFYSMAFPDKSTTQCSPVCQHTASTVAPFRLRITVMECSAKL